MFTSALQILCNQYNIQIPSISISKRLKVTAATYRPNEIRISLLYYNTNGYLKTLKVVKHEFIHHYLFCKYAHLSAKEQWKKSAHTTEFKEMALKIDASMNSSLARGKYESLREDNFISSKFRWQYVCDCSIVLRKTKRALSDKELSKYQCKSCLTTMHQKMKRKIL